ncbi:uncharacterized protein GLRG_09022 [Colletotrichum graminicola M1.001]|uniref:Uncharacterized protein n=1 Tax=Colletotrichum graminicola (strain M1.001 / M2 / FGSC 10212) TaxID=645133 RepID=E3QSP0_COLGM|nr:uncharacterized protein GLRG_09022 [Colletotrichum graminicola M1.001]EFQ33878.1 hypothetical protein GLRG_09022 [Colletotrichum graminicola M1.001]
MVQPTLVASRLTQKPPSLTMPQAGNYPVPQDNESQVDSAAESLAYSPCSENELGQGERSIPENPFDSESSRILFEAIDRLQSCGVSQEVAIPQSNEVRHNSNGIVVICSGAK